MKKLGIIGAMQQEVETLLAEENFQAETDEAEEDFLPEITDSDLELDFAGKKLSIRDRRNPEQMTPVTIFVATLSFSDYFYIEGMTCCDISNWIRVNNNALSYFGGITQKVTPDNCKVAVAENRDWINPSVNKDFQAWAEHNGTVIMPAKVKSPRWKPNVEGHVKIVTMHILVEMDEMTFYSLEELNAVLWQKMEQENIPTRRLSV